MVHSTGGSLHSCLAPLSARFPFLLTHASLPLARWYFWVIIGIIAAFFGVAAYFTIRGFIRYRHLYKVSPPGREGKEINGASDAARRTAALVGATHAPAGLQSAHRMKKLVKVNPRFAQP